MTPTLQIVIMQLKNKKNQITIKIYYKKKLKLK